ncbi:MAG: hypothetical protein Q9159_006678 [Coniocarpon cinnabarinum]
MSNSRLKYAKYGKDNVRVLKVHKDKQTGVQDVFEFTIQTMLEGDIETSYTKADNSLVVPTDTQKQTIYILAKKHPVSPPEVFAALLAQHFLDKYKHIHVAHVDLEQVSWTRLTIDGQPHPHSFIEGGSEKRSVSVTAAEGKGIEVRSGIKDLLVLKSTGSAFYGYDTSDPYTRLPETRDRILSTAVDCTWTWQPFERLVDVEERAALFNDAFPTARKVTLDFFAKENSPSVQNTMYKMANDILRQVSDVVEVEYTLPNKHYFECDLSWVGGENLRNVRTDAEVYMPQTDPNGLINCIVSRK